MMIIIILMMMMKKTKKKKKKNKNKNKNNNNNNNNNKMMIIILMRKKKKRRMWKKKKNNKKNFPRHIPLLPVVYLKEEDSRLIPTVSTRQSLPSTNVFLNDIHSDSDGRTNPLDNLMFMAMPALSLPYSFNTGGPGRHRNRVTGGDQSKSSCHIHMRRRGPRAATLMTLVTAGFTTCLV